MAAALDTALLDQLTDLASRAAAAILAIAPSDRSPRLKADQSPVTAADEAADAVIAEGLSQLLPGLPVISEERCPDAPALAPDASFALVDPLDGTREFLAGRDEYTVNIALVSGGYPVAGVIAVPARSLIYRGIVGVGAERLRLKPGQGPANAREATPIRCRAAPRDGVIAAVSRSHLDTATMDFLAGFPRARQVAAGSSLKFCCVAEGSADIYPRLAPVYAWDAAAGHAVLAAAGGAVLTPQGTPLRYSGSTKAGLLIPAFIAWGDQTFVAGSRQGAG